MFQLFDYGNEAKEYSVKHKLTKSKSIFSASTQCSKGQNPHLEKQIWVNFGNCLDFLGRGIEALNAYDEALVIDPKFAMAIGNKAITSRHFARISGLYTAAIHIDAYQAIQAVIDDEEIVVIGGRGAKQHFEEVLKDTEARITDKKVLEQCVPHVHYDEFSIIRL